MATYLVLNIVVIALVCAALWGALRRPDRPWIVMFLSLLLLTLVFDNIMIALDFFSYAPDKILGLYVWLAPVEDFMYPVLAALLIPTLWNMFGAKDA